MTVRTSGSKSRIGACLSLVIFVALSAGCLVPPSAPVQSTQFEGPDPAAVAIGYGVAAVFTTNANLAGWPSLPAHVPSYYAALPSFTPYTFHDSLPVVPSWADPGIVWAPTVRGVGGRYLMFFSTQPTKRLPDGTLHANCIGAATSNDGVTFNPENTVKWCDSQSSLTGLFDPQLFVSPTGTAYLLYSRQWVTSSNHSEIDIQQLSANGLTKVGSSSVLLSYSDVSSLNPNVGSNPFLENPSFMTDEYNNYDLIASLGTWTSPGYVTIEVPCLAITSNCIPSSGGLILANSTPGSLQGPGGASLVGDGNPDGNWMFWHAGPQGSRNVFAGTTTASNPNSTSSALAPMSMRSAAISASLPAQTASPVVGAQPHCWPNRVSDPTAPPVCAGS